ncbi:hypothetical protein FI667_g17519, partial [Globisporangium splendens]
MELGTQSRNASEPQDETNDRITSFSEMRGVQATGQLREYAQSPGACTQGSRSHRLSIRSDTNLSSINTSDMIFHEQPSRAVFSLPHGPLASRCHLSVHRDSHSKGEEFDDTSGSSSSTIKIHNVDASSQNKYDASVTKTGRSQIKKPSRYLREMDRRATLARIEKGSRSRRWRASTS